MKINEVLKLLEEVAPLELSDRYCKQFGAYDNSGIIINTGEEICGALFSLNLSLKTVAECKAKGFNLIVTHHPAIYGGIDRIGTDSAIAECIKCGISVISMHLNFDFAPKGIDYHLMRGIGGAEAKTLENLEGGSYGRVYKIEKKSFSKLVTHIKKTFKTERLMAFGNDREIDKVASFCGAGCDARAIEFAISNGAKALVSSDLKEHEISYLVGHGVNVIQLSHYAAESYGFNKIYDALVGLKLPKAYYNDEELL